MTSRIGWSCVLFAALLAARASAGQPAPQPTTGGKASEATIARLIGELGSKDFKARDRATRRLKEINAALPALRKALHAPGSEEVRRRAESVIAVIEARLAEIFIREAVARVNEEGLDLFIDRMVLQNGYANDARWKAALELTRALTRRAARAGASLPNFTAQDFLKLPVVKGADVQFGRPSRMVCEGADKLFGALHNCLLLSSGALEGINSTNQSILFVNGDIKSLNSTTNSIIICNGTIKNMNYTKGCLIYCNGVIESMNYTEGNAVFVRGELRRLNFTKNNVLEAKTLGPGNVSEGNTYLNRKEIARAGRGDRFTPAEPSPLALFSFFDPARLGATFTMVDGDARAERIAEGKPFARAGLKQGDLVLAVNRQKFLTEADFVRLLRRRVVASQALLKVQRGDRVLTLDAALAP